MKIDIAFDKKLLNSGIQHYHTIDFSKCPHLMTVGASGSGKTFLNKLIIARISLKITNSQITILDFKADDYHFSRNSKRLFEFEQVKEGLEHYYQEFLARQQGKDSDRSFRLLVIEELGSMLGYFDKKDSEAIKTMIANIVFMGRSMNCHVLLSTQRADASYFNSGVRDSISVIIGLGNLSKEGKSMLFSGFQDDMTDLNGQGSGYMLINGAELHSIKVPQVENIKKLEHYIIQSLIR